MILMARFHGVTLRYSGRGSELCLASLKMHHRATQRRQQTVRDPGSDDKLVEIILNIFTRNKSTRWALDPSASWQGTVPCNRTAVKPKRRKDGFRRAVDILALGSRRQPIGTARHAPAQPDTYLKRCSTAEAGGLSTEPSEVASAEKQDAEALRGRSRPREGWRRTATPR